MRTKQVAGRVYNYGYCIGRTGQAGNGFQYPMDFALGSGGTVYVVSRGQEFNPAQGITKCTLNHDFLWDQRGLGFGGSQLGGGLSPWPTSVDLDRDENVYISDDYTGVISRYDKDGTALGTWGKKGSADGEVNGPSGIAFDKEDNLFVVDGLNHRIQKFTKDGRFLAKWGSYGSGQGELNTPWGIAIDKEGDVYVADWKNDRVQKFSPDGKYLATIGGPGTGEGDLHRPAGVAIDDEGDVYVADWGTDRLKIFTSDATFITSFVGDAEKLSPWAQDGVDANPDYHKARQRADLTPEKFFSRPVAVNVDEEGRIIVADQCRQRLQIYIKERDFVDAAFNL